MKDINALVSWIEDNALTPENMKENGDIDFDFVEADIELSRRPSAVADPLPELPFDPDYSDIEAAFDIIVAR